MIAILIAITFSSVISYLWVKGIDNMKKKHPHYKGDDFLEFNKDQTHND